MADTDIDTIGIVGAGAMGAGVAQTAAAAGIRVILFDQNPAATAKAALDIAARLRRLVEKKQMSAADAEAAIGRVTIADSLDAMAAAQLVIEAIVERLEPKQALFGQLESIVAPDAILASNTSALPIAAIARNCKRRERVCGMHFFNPVPLMKLVEVIRAPATSDETVDRAVAVSHALGKTPVRVNDAPGFLVNLANRAFGTEALHLLQERVADVATIDQIMRGAIGFRMGPFELMDLTGIDVNFPSAMIMYAGYHHDPRLRTTAFHEALFNAGLFGRKTGRGYHDYTSESAPKADQPVKTTPITLVAAVNGDHPGFAVLRATGVIAPGGDDRSAILVAPEGEDASTITARLGLDRARVVAIDFVGLERKFLTLMAPPGGSTAIDAVRTALQSHGYQVAIINDCAGFVAQRIVSAIGNLGCEMAQIGVGTPRDIDTAMRLGMNYPRGPLEFVDWLGADVVHRIMVNLQAVTGSDRYRPSLWLRRRALLGLPIHTPD